MKSLVLMYMALCIAAGLPCAPRLDGAFSGFPVHQANVLWVDFDNGRKRTRQRLRAFMQALGLRSLPGFSYVSMPELDLDLTTPEGERLLDQAVKQHGAQFVILDNLSAIRGVADERDNSEMTVVMRRAKNVAERNNAAIIVIHHDVRDGSRFSGAGAIERWPDLTLKFERPDPQEPTVIITPEKQRDSHVRGFAVTLQSQQRPEPERQGELLEAQFFTVPMANVPNSSAEKRATLEAFITNLLIERGDLCKLDITRAAKEEGKGGREAIDTMLQRMEASGKVRSRDGGKNNARLYSLKEKEKNRING